LRQTRLTVSSLTPPPQQRAAPGGPAAYWCRPSKRLRSTRRPLVRKLSPSTSSTHHKTLHPAVL
jgi:hypothetical protein